MSSLQKAHRLPALLARVSGRHGGMCLGPKVRSPACRLHPRPFSWGQRGSQEGKSDLLFTCRTKHTSGSPRHKGLKKTHFIKNMRQYDTKNSRCQRVPAQPQPRGCPPGPPSCLLGSGVLTLSATIPSFSALRNCSPTRPSPCPFGSGPSPHPTLFPPYSPNAGVLSTSGQGATRPPQP